MGFRGSSRWLTTSGRVGIRLGFRAGVGRRGQRLVEIAGFDTRIIERVAATTMRQREFSRQPDVVLADGDSPRRVTRRSMSAAPGRMSHRGARNHQISPHPVHIESRTQCSYPVHLTIGQLDLVHQFTGGGDPDSQVAVGIGVPGRKSSRVGFVIQSSADHLAAHRHLAGGVHIDGQTEPVEQLRTQFALLGIHGSDQDET